MLDVKAISCAFMLFFGEECIDSWYEEPSYTVSNEEMAKIFLELGYSNEEHIKSIETATTSVCEEYADFEETCYVPVIFSNMQISMFIVDFEYEYE